MFRLGQYAYIPLLVLLISFDSLRSMSRIYTGFFPLTYTLGFITVICIFWYKIFYFSPNNSKIYRIVFFYWLWLLISVIRGMNIVENPVEWRQLVVGSFSLIAPLYLYVFSTPETLHETLRLWVKFAFTAFAVLFLFIPTGGYHYYLGPLFLLGCFWPIMPKGLKMIVLFLLFFMMTINLGDRSQVIKSGISLMIGVGFLLSKYIKPFMLSILHWFFYIVPIVLLYLGVTGIFNPFAYMAESADGKYLQQELVEGHQEDYAADTRTFIYEEVVTSAVRHNYIWQGRTPARGNDSWALGIFTAEDLKTGKYERHYNEVCHPNVFTWLGLIGIILYSLMYLISSFLALYKSNSIWMKFIGVYIAFRWAFGWIEDISEFDISCISLWMIIAMGFSESFRQMNNDQIQKWVLKVFNR